MRTVIASLLLAAAIAPAASARTSVSPCRDHGAFRAGIYLNGHRLDPQPGNLELVRMTDHYLACGPHFKVPRSTTHWAQDETPICHHYFKVGNTSKGHTDPHQARWDYWTTYGEWVLWNGFGSWLHNSHDGNAVRFVPALHNWNYFQEWAAQIFIHCVRTHVPHD